MKSKITKLQNLMFFLKEHNLFLLAKIIRIYIRIIYSCEIYPTCKIENSVLFPHNGLGVVIHSEAIIGKNTKILPNVIIGGRNSESCPVIGENVLIGAGACILGDIKIGNNVKIGANAIVVDDIPNNTTVVGMKSNKLNLEN
jgi:serine O-acetyltransferase